jgi:hypothetical protein
LTLSSYLSRINVDFRYFDHRENNVFADEEKRLRDGECELKKVVQAEQDLKLMVGKVSWTDNSKTHKQKFPLEQKFMDLCKKLNITIEEEEEKSGDESADESSSKPKRQKLEDT